MVRYSAAFRIASPTELITALFNNRMEMASLASRRSRQGQAWMGVRWDNGVRNWVWAVSGGSPSLKGSASGDPLHRLPGDLRDAIVILIVVPDSRACDLGNRCYKEIRNLGAPVVECLLVRQGALYLEGSGERFLPAGKLVKRIKPLGSQVVITRALCTEQNLETDRRGCRDTVLLEIASPKIDHLWRRTVVPRTRIREQES